MTAFSRSLSIIALLFAAAPFAAKADEISFSTMANTASQTFGVSYNTSNGEVAFTPSGSAQASISGSSTGIFKDFNVGTATFYNFDYIPADNPSSTFELFSVDSGSNTIVFDADSSSLKSTPGDGGLTVSGTGTYSITDNGTTTTYTGGSFTFTTQAGTEEVSFSDTNYGLAATPEPSSLLLMGTGLMSMGAVVMRRRRQGAAANFAA